MADLVTRAPADADTPAILALFADAYGRPMTAAHYEWKARTRSGPVDNASAMFQPDGVAATHVAGIPCRARLASDAAEGWVMIAIDAATAPALRRQGLLSRNLPELFAKWRAAGIKLVLGLPNQQWGSRARALGWKPLFPLGWLVLPLAPERLLARRLHLPLLGQFASAGRAWNWRWSGGAAARDIAIESLSSAPSEADDLWATVSPRVGSSIVRDREWLGWRYFSHPDIRYEVIAARRNGRLAGYAAWRIYDWDVARSATIAEAWCAPDDAAVFRELGRAVLRRLVDARVDVVRTLAVPGSVPYQRWRSLGFFRSRFAFDVEYVPLNIRGDASALHDAAGWWMCAGDFDVV